MNLKDRVSIVTGAGQGIGKAIAQRLASAGSHVVIADIIQETAEETSREIARSAPGTRGFAALADVTVRGDVEALMRAVEERLGTIHILVNNSGITADALLVRLSPTDYSRVLRVNLLGAANCIRAAAPYMQEERRGRIINIASVIGLIGNIGQANYAASKSGLISLTRVAARKLGSWGITVNAVAPGFIRTQMTARLPAETVGEMQSRIPLGRLGEVEDVAAAVSFLASDAASYITGQILTVDGGMVM